MGQIPTCQTANAASPNDSPPIPVPVCTAHDAPAFALLPAKVQASLGTIGLNMAAAAGDVQAVRYLLEERVNVNAADYDKRTPLHIAASEGHLDVLNLLLAFGADVSAKDRWGRTALDDANTGCAATRAALRSAGADHGNTPTNATSLHGNLNGQEDTPLSLPLSKAPWMNEPQHKQKQHLKNGKSEDQRSTGCNSHTLDKEESFSTVSLLSPDCPSAMGIKSVQEQLGFLRHVSHHQSWAIPEEQVHFGKVIMRTRKSVIYAAMWRGMKVAAKCTLAMEKLVYKNGATASVVEADEDALHEVLHEISLLQSMRHPNLVMFLGACLEAKPPFFITEFMEGGDMERYYMAQASKANHPYRPPWSLFIKWSIAVARALSFLHNCTQPVIHRDLKPMNILLDSHMNAKVTDFGISKVMTCRVAKDAANVPPMSGGVGTWRYMAPEVVRYEQYTDAVDIYSFALIMWFMHTGLQPLVAEFGPDAELVLKAYLRRETPRPSLAKFPAELGRLIHECWCEDPSVRPSAEDCTERLTALGNEGKLTKMAQNITGYFKSGQRWSR